MSSGFVWFEIAENDALRQNLFLKNDAKLRGKILITIITFCCIC